jgi:hypothetical protein
MFVNITKSTRAGKKMMAIFYDMNKKKVKTTHFGQETASDYTIHGDMQRKANYIARHKAREDWNDYMSSGSLAYYILWNKPTLTASIEDYINRFKLKKY